MEKFLFLVHIADFDNNFNSKNISKNEMCNGGIIIQLPPQHIPKMSVRLKSVQNDRNNRQECRLKAGQPTLKPASWQPSGGQCCILQQPCPT